MTDPIADMLSRIRNAQKALHESVDIPFSKLKLAILKIIRDAGYVVSCEVTGEKPQDKKIHVVLKYGKQGEGVIQKLMRISKPSCRYYIKNKNLKPVRNGMGISIISTPKGLLVDSDARKSSLGGEVLCKIW